MASGVSIAEALTTVTMALVLPRRGRPDDGLIRRALCSTTRSISRLNGGCCRVIRLIRDSGQITAALAAGHDRETLPAAPAVDTAAQPNPRTRRGPEPAR